MLIKCELCNLTSKYTKEDVIIATSTSTETYLKPGEDFFEAMKRSKITEIEHRGVICPCRMRVICPCRMRVIELIEQ